ncbi:MAG: hypothetical protein ACOYEG_03435 [Petrimonas sp.]
MKNEFFSYKRILVAQLTTQTVVREAVVSTHVRNKNKTRKIEKPVAPATGFFRNNQTKTTIYAEIFSR